MSANDSKSSIASQRLGVPFDLGQIARAPGFEVPDIEGTVEGWRAWVVARKVPPFGVKPRLRSVIWDYTWYPMQTAEAHCDHAVRGEHKPADARCSCGFYSAKTLKHLMHMGYHGFSDYDADEYVKVVGRVANWGQVTEGTLGWRSQYSYPVMLFVPFAYNHLAKPLQDAFGCKIRLLNFQKQAGTVDQLKAVAGEVQPIKTKKQKQQGRRCEHKTLPFKGYLGGEPYMKDGEEWVEVRWDARMDDPVQMKMSNLNLAKVRS